MTNEEIKALRDAIAKEAGQWATKQHGSFIALMAEEYGLPNGMTTEFLDMLIAPSTGRLNCSQMRGILEKAGVLTPKTEGATGAKGLLAKYRKAAEAIVSDEENEDPDAE